MTVYLQSLNISHWWVRPDEVHIQHACNNVKLHSIVMQLRASVRPPRMRSSGTQPAYAAAEQAARDSQLAASIVRNLDGNQKVAGLVCW